jgi:cold shock CspA family protein
MENIGTIKRIFEARGFGFIQSAKGDEWFFHARSTEDFADLCVGHKVTFTLGTRRESGRAEARQVRRAR